MKRNTLQLVGWWLTQWQLSDDWATDSLTYSLTAWLSDEECRTFIGNRCRDIVYCTQNITHRLHDFLHVAFWLRVALCALEDSALFLPLHVTEHHWPVLSTQLLCRPQVDYASTTCLYWESSLQSPIVEMLGWKVTDRLVLHGKTIVRINAYYMNTATRKITSSITSFHKNYNNKLIWRSSIMPFVMTDYWKLLGTFA